MDTKIPIPDLQEATAGKPSAGFQINFKRILSHIIRFWYLIVLSLLASLFVAYMVNRYSSRIYPVVASIIIKEHDENVGAKFLYNNELLNPYRNFYNEIYIMKSYPLIEEVLVSLGFGVTIYREGEIKTTEYYESDFPVEFRVLPGSKKLTGKSIYFTISDQQTFTLQYVTDNTEDEGKLFSSLPFNDTVRVNGFVLNVLRKGDVSRLIGTKFTVAFKSTASLAKQYSNRLSATWAQPGAAVVNLSILGPLPQKEIDFLNRFIERYQHYDVEKKNKAATMALRFLDDQLYVIGDSLKMYEDQVENFKRRNIITNLDAETSRLFQKLKDFEEQKFQYHLTENYFDYIITMLQNEQYDGIFTPASLGITDQVVATLITELIALQTEVNLYEDNRKRGVDKLLNNPRLIEKLQRINYLKGDIQKTIENSRKTQQINVKLINNQIRLVEEQLSRLPRSERELVTIQRNYSLKETLYIYLLEKRTEAGLSKASTTSDITVVNPPMAGGPVSPKISQNLSVGAGIGLALPLLVFILMEVFNDRIQSREDIVHFTSVPVIGGIGHNESEGQLVVYAKPRSAMAESFRALRSNLNYFTGNKEHLVFMVTSSIPGEGKSFTTLNLASVLAMAGKRTLVLGADLRRPKLFDDLKLRNDKGLSQYLSGMATLEDVLQTSTIENLFLISGGPMPPNPSELLLRPAMDKLIAELREKFDFVVIDTPPLSFVADAFVLAKYVDHTLYVIRQDFTPNGALQSLEEYYQIGKLTNISILFNDLQKIGLGYGYGYSYGYSYGTKKKTDGTGYYEE